MKIEAVLRLNPAMGKRRMRDAICPGVAAMNLPALNL